LCAKPAVRTLETVAKVGLLDTAGAKKRVADPRAAWLIELVAGAEKLAADLAENPAGREYSAGATALVRRAQALGEDILEQAVADGWLTRAHAGEVLRGARMGAASSVVETAVRAKAPRAPR
jgi:hypothetical protein